MTTFWQSSHYYMLVKQGKGQVVGIVVVSVGVRCHLAGGRGWVKIPPVVVIVLRSNNNASRCSSLSIVVLSTTHPPLDNITAAVATTSSSSPHLLSLRRQMPALVAASVTTLPPLLFLPSLQQPSPHRHTTVFIIAKNATAALLFLLGTLFPTVDVAALPHTLPQQHVDCHFPRHCHSHSPLNSPSTCVITCVVVQRTSFVNTLSLVTRVVARA